MVLNDLISVTIQLKCVWGTPNIVINGSMRLPTLIMIRKSIDRELIEN